MAEGQYRIVKVELPLLGGIAGHNFLALIDPNGNVIGEFHGLATDAEGRAKPIGNLPSDRLKGHDDKRWYQPDFAQAEVATGNQSEIMNRWNAARAASDKMDTRDIQYPWMGLGQNSNSFASTLIAAMGLTEPRMPGGAFVVPGSGSMLLDPKDIRDVQRQFNIGAPRSRDTPSTDLQLDDVDQPNSLDSARWPSGPVGAPSERTTPPPVGKGRSTVASPQDLRSMTVHRAEGATSLGGPNGPAPLVPPVRSRAPAPASSDASGRPAVATGLNSPSLLRPSSAAPHVSPDATLPAVLQGAGLIGDGNGIGDWWDGLGVAPSADAAPATVRKLSSGDAQPDPSSSAALTRSAALAGVAARQPGSLAFPSVPFPLEALLASDRALEQWASSSPRRDASPSATEASTGLPGSNAPVGGNPFNLGQPPADGLLGMIQDYMRNNGY